MKNKKIIIAVAILLIIAVAVIVGIYTIGEIKKQKRDYKIEEISEYKYFVLKENQKFGVIDKNGNKIIESKYENVIIPNPSKAVFFCNEAGEEKVLNEKAEYIFNEYDKVEPLRLKNIASNLTYEKSVLKYTKEGKLGLIDFQGKKITKEIYDEIDTLQFKEGELLVKKDNKYGIINIKGTILIDTNYDKIEADKYYESDVGYKNSGYIVSNITDQGYRYGYVKLNGKQLLNTEYNELYRITEIESKDIYLICANNGKYGLIKNDKKIIDNEYQALNYNENNIFLALKGKKYGIISNEGNVIVPFKYSQIDIKGKNIYATLNDSEVEIFNLKGEKQDIDENTVISEIKDTNYKIYNKTEENKTTYSIYENDTKKTNKEYNYIEYLYENYFIACNNEGKLGIIDSDEKIKLDFKYNAIQKIDNMDIIQVTSTNTKLTEIYSKNLEKVEQMNNANIENKNEYIVLYNNKETKYVSKDGKKLNNTEVFENNKIFTKQQGKLFGFVDKNGNKILEFKYEDATEVNEYGYAGIKQNGKWGIIDSDGHIVLEPTYKLEDNKKPKFIDKYYEVVYGNGEIYYTNSK